MDELRGQVVEVGLQRVPMKDVDTPTGPEQQQLCHLIALYEGVPIFFERAIKS